MIHIARRLDLPEWLFPEGQIHVSLECDRCRRPSFLSFPAAPETLDIVVRALRLAADDEGWRPCPLMDGGDAVGVGDLCAACWAELRGRPKGRRRWRR